MGNIILYTIAMVIFIGIIAFLLYNINIFGKLLKDNPMELIAAAWVVGLTIFGIMSCFL